MIIPKDMTLRIFLQKVKFKIFEKIEPKIISRMRLKKIKDKNFTIISNNCFAGWVYRKYNLQYLTPTVGLFIMPDCYMKFLSNLKYYINDCELKFILPENSKYKEYISNKDSRFGKYPIGILDDIEIHFLHYADEEEAKNKWNRRKERINWDKLIIKFNDQNGANFDHIKEFFDKPFCNKICFVGKKDMLYDDAIYVKEFELVGYIMDDTWFCDKYLDLNNFLNLI